MAKNYAINPGVAVSSAPHGLKVDGKLVPSSDTMGARSDPEGLTRMMPPVSPVVESVAPQPAQSMFEQESESGSAPGVLWHLGWFAIGFVGGIIGVLACFLVNRGRPEMARGLSLSMIGMAVNVAVAALVMLFFGQQIADLFGGTSSVTVDYQPME